MSCPMAVPSAEMPGGSSLAAGCSVGYAQQDRRRGLRWRQRFGSVGSMPADRRGDDTIAETRDRRPAFRNRFF